MKTRPAYNVVAIANGGPDWSVKSMLNLMSLGYLWKNLKLDVLVVQCYALTNWLVRVVLPDDMNGSIPKDNDNEAWDEVLENAVKLCAKFWGKKFYTGFRIRVEEFLTTNLINPILKSTHQLLHDFTNASKKSKFQSLPNSLSCNKITSSLFDMTIEKRTRLSLFDVAQSVLAIVLRYRSEIMNY